MKKIKFLIAAIMLFCSCNLKAQNWDKIAREAQIKTDSFFAHRHFDYPPDELSELKNIHRAVEECQLLTIEGFKEIRHDALILLRFRYAHEIKKQLKEMQ